MKTDHELQDDVLSALEWEPGVDATTIHVSVTNGVATLQGTARSVLEKSTAGAAARNVYGIRAVANDLMVLPAATTRPRDSEIAEAVANALAWDSAVPLNAIKATVADGWVTLTGVVEWQYQKSAAQIAAERMSGVRGVVNLITLQPRVASADVKAKIESAFRRSANIDAAHVEVDAHGGTVTLRGTVKSLAERDEAERAAWSAPGVTHVDDRIAVAPFGS